MALTYIAKEENPRCSFVLPSHQKKKKKNHPQPSPHLHKTIA